MPDGAVCPEVGCRSRRGVPSVREVMSAAARVMVDVPTQSRCASGGKGRSAVVRWGIGDRTGRVARTETKTKTSRDVGGLFLGVSLLRCRRFGARMRHATLDERRMLHGFYRNGPWRGPLVLEPGVDGDQAPSPHASTPSCRLAIVSGGWETEWCVGRASRAEQRGDPGRRLWAVRFRS
uniref:Uncharacterized protein n=1 Tax=Mycena chlorophos TaxID=658473 RepID=A0ABQ0LQK0_MYCCL|nr:predicted protein [Mycena chlorophos]